MSVCVLITITPALAYPPTRVHVATGDRRLDHFEELAIYISPTLRQPLKFPIAGDHNSK